MKASASSVSSTSSASSAPFDLLVIGGGPGGYVAALRAAQLGLRTALIEREHLGGICLNWGCIPTKSLLHTADLLRGLEHAADLGLAVGSVDIDFPRVMRRSREVADRLRRGVTQLLARAKVTVIEGHASIAKDKSIEVRGADGATQRLQTRHTLLATGARPRALPGLAFDGDRIWSYREALAATAMPASIAVIGAGAIGLEFASFFRALGAEVTVIEARDRPLAEGDAEVSAFVARTLARDGIGLRVGARVEQVLPGARDVEIRLAGSHGAKPERLKAERVLVAIGLEGNTQSLGLEHTRVRVESGRVIADAWGATDEPGLHAIGDLVGAPMLAHKASHEALACVERIAGLHAGAPAPHPLIPACTYGHPQTASIGLTEAQARARGEVRVGRFPLEGNGKAIAIGEASGFVKTVFDAASGELLGAHIVGPEAPELIQGFAIAATLESTEAELMETVFPHPTVSEAMHESVLAAFGRALHA